MTPVAPIASFNPRLQVVALVVGGVGLIVTVLLGLNNLDGFFRSYLMAEMLWLGLALGCLGVVLVQFLTGGQWGFATRRIFEAGVGTVPLMAVLFVPILFGLPRLYAWAQPADVAADVILQHRAPYLNLPFVLGRSIVYLAVWVALALVLRRWSLIQDENDDLLILRRLQRFSVIGLIALGFTVSFAAIDWLMSLDADWYSTMYPPLVGTSFMLFALAFGILMTTTLAGATQLREVVTPRLFNDLGSLLLAFLMLWGYMEYFQYLLIWAGNLTDEIPWYLRRIEGGWLGVALALGGIGFLVPFWFLLFRPLKRNPRTLRAIAALLIVMRLVDTYWLVKPPFEPGGPLVSWLDIAAVVGLGGVWLAVFLRQLTGRPLLVRYDPRFVPALEAAREAT